MRARTSGDPRVGHGPWLAALLVILLTPSLATGPMGAGARVPASAGPSAPVTLSEPRAGLDAHRAERALTSGFPPIGNPAESWLLSNDSALPGLRMTQNGSSPGVLAVDPMTGVLWLGYNRSSPGVEANLTLVDLGDSEVVGAIPDTPNVTALWFDAATNWMFVGENPNGTTARVAVLNATTYAPVTGPIAVGPDPDAFVYDPHSGELFVGGTASANLTEIDLPTFATRSVPIDLAGLYYPEVTSLAYDPVNGDVYVLASSAQVAVTVLNGSTGALVAPEIVGPYTYTNDTTILYDPADDRLFVLERNVSYGSSILVIDPEVQAAVGSVAVGGGPDDDIYANSMVLDPLNDAILFIGARWWSSFDEGDLGLLFPSNGTFEWTSSFVGLGPSYQAFDAATGIDYVAHEGQSYISGVDPANGSTRIPLIELGGSPGAGTFDPQDGQVDLPEAYWDDDAADHGSLPNALLALTPGSERPAEVEPIGPSSGGPASSSTGYAPVAVVYDAGSDRLFVADSGSDNVTVLSAATGEADGSVRLPFAPMYEADDPVDGLVIFADTAEAQAVDAANGSLAAHYDVAYACTAPPPGLLELLAVDPTSGLVYLAPNIPVCGGTPGLVAWNPANGSATKFNVNGYPFWNDVAYDPVDGDLYITETESDDLAVVGAQNGTTLATVGVGASPDFVAFDPDGDLVLVADEGSDNVTVLNGTSAAAAAGPTESVPAGNGPSAITVASTIDQVFVSDGAGGSVIEYATTPEIGAARSLTAAVDVGTTAELRVEASGGSGNLSYSYRGLPPGCDSEDAPALSCTPTGNGSFSIGITVTDEVGATASATFPLLVEPAPSLRLTATPTTLDGAGIVDLGAIVTGGSAPFSVAWSYGDGSNGTGLGSEHAYVRPGRYSVGAVLRDAAGATASAATTVVVGGPLSVAIEGVVAAVPAGTMVNWTAGAIGGIGPYTFTWSFGDGSGFTTGVSSLPNESSVAHVFAAAGTYRVRVTIEDGGGETATGNSTVRVTGPSAVAPASKPFPWVDAGLGLADLLVAVGLVALVLRRRRSSTVVPAGAAPPGRP